MVWFKNDGESYVLKQKRHLHLSYYLESPLRTRRIYGPFVMNNEEELQQAVFDFQSGQMGNLTETLMNEFAHS